MVVIKLNGSVQNWIFLLDEKRHKIRKAMKGKDSDDEWKALAGAFMKKINRVFFLLVPYYADSIVHIRCKCTLNES